MKQSELKKVIREALETDPEIRELLIKIHAALQSMDKSIDYLGAAMTGRSAADVEMGQAALGRFASPVRRRATARKVDPDIREGKKISMKKLREYIVEEINNIEELTYAGAPETTFAGFDSSDLRTMFAKFFHHDRQAPRWHIKAAEFARYLKALKIDKLDLSSNLAYSGKGSQNQRAHSPHTLYNGFKRRGYSFRR
jgi:hypothetical protein